MRLAGFLPAVWTAALAAIAMLLLVRPPRSGTMAQHG
jgi:hypothetical protein